MVGTGEAYLGAFAIALGWGSVGTGLLTTWPMLAGGALQLLTPAGVRRLGSRKKWVVLCAAVQAASFVPLIVLGLLGSRSLWALFAVATLYWSAGMAAGPAWNPWVGTLIPKRVRAAFFARRSLATQLGTAAALFSGAAVLHAWEKLESPLIGFVFLFGVAALARAASTLLLIRHPEPEPPTNEKIVGIKEIFGRLRRGTDGRFLLFLAAMTASVNIGSPFFTPYFLKELELDYPRYVGLVGTAFLAKIIALSWLGRVANRIGSAQLLRYGAAAIVPVAGLWAVSDHYGYMLGLEFLSGTAWAAYDLAAFLMLFETIKEKERTSLLSSYNFIHTVAVLLGSSIGALALTWIPQSREGFYTVFVGSTAARLVVAVFLLRLGWGRVGRVSSLARNLRFRTISVRPTAGGMLRPIWPSAETDGPDDTAGPGPDSLHPQNRPSNAPDGRTEN